MSTQRTPTIVLFQEFNIFDTRAPRETFISDALVRATGAQVVVVSGTSAGIPSRRFSRNVLYIETPHRNAQELQDVFARHVESDSVRNASLFVEEIPELGVAPVIEGANKPVSSLVFDAALGLSADDLQFGRDHHVVVFGDEVNLLLSRVGLTNRTLLQLRDVESNLFETQSTAIETAGRKFFDDAIRFNAINLHALTSSFNLDGGPGSLVF